MTIQEERVFLAKAECIPEITAFVVALAEQAELPPKRLLQLELVIEEMVLNICHYAYAVPPGEIVMRVNAASGKFVIEFEDGGVPFDPLAADEPDVTLHMDEREAGGLGIFLVRRMTDEVHYQRRDGRNVLAVAIYTQ